MLGVVGKRWNEHPARPPHEVGYLAAQGRLTALEIRLMRLSLILGATLLIVACVPAAIPSPTPATGSSTTSEPTRDQTEEWIEVVLDEQRVNLWQGSRLITSLSMSSGVGISPETTTYPGEYRVATMYPGPEESAPGVFVRDIVIFDWEHGNGFHSLTMDAGGNVLDSTIGTPATAGCIRLKDSARLYSFARIGMRVLIH